jgi:SAM-dependent methyltransferase
MDRAESIQKHFGNAAAAYAVSPVHLGGPDLEAMLEAATLSGTERVLDLGCGPGHTALAFAARGVQVTAVDLTPAMLEQGRRLAVERGLSVRFQQADAAALPFEAGAFDVVTSRLSAHHYADPPAVLREVARVLVPDGRFLLVDVVAPEDAARDTFLNAFELLRDPSHVRDHRVSEWEAMFRAAGLVPECLGRWPIHQEFAPWVERIGTSPGAVVGLRALFEEAPGEVRRAFGIDGGETFSMPSALLRGRARA